MTRSFLSAEFINKLSMPNASAMNSSAYDAYLVPLFPDNRCFIPALTDLLEGKFEKFEFSRG